MSDDRDDGKPRGFETNEELADRKEAEAAQEAESKERQERLRAERLERLAAGRAKSIAVRSAAAQRRREIGEEIPVEEKRAKLPFALDPDIADILTAKELEELYVQAKATVAAEVKAKRKKEIQDRLLNIARREAGLLSMDETQREFQKRMEEIVPITIHLAEYCDRIVLDGVIYLHGRTYQVSRAAYETMTDQMGLTWRHQAELDGKRKNYYSEMHGGFRAFNGGVMTGSVAGRI